jgi:hypothetical protein
LRIKQCQHELDLASIRPGHELFPKSKTPEAQAIVTPSRDVVVPELTPSAEEGV